MFLLLKQRMKPVSEPIVRHCYDVRLLIGEGKWDLPLFEKQRIEKCFLFYCETCVIDRQAYRLIVADAKRYQIFSSQCCNNTIFES